MQLSIPSDILWNSGNCRSAIIHKLFDLYCVDGFGYIFKHGGKLLFSKPERKTEEYDINSSVHFGPYHFDQVLSECFSVTNTYIDNGIDLSEIKGLIDSGVPVLLQVITGWCDWLYNNPGNETAFHNCLAVGYNDETQSFICIDPSLTDRYCELSYIHADSRHFAYQYYDFSDFRLTGKSSLKEELCDFLVDNPSFESASETLMEIHNEIRENMERFTVTPANVNKISLNEHISYHLKARLNAIHSYFEYLMEKYNEPWLDELVDIYFDNYSQASSAYMLIIKYQLTENLDIVERFTNRLKNYANNERKAIELIKARI